ncbi:dihydroneopterin aldolase [Desulfallas sp. Bu1-1]|uniref:dihydroneopterin aldolase n=1 Tax=Desulfallas sp. Bu1-1 TaxID=2787620 RepID=UPI0037BFE8A2
MDQLDKIIMSSMAFYGYHGVLPQERELGQTFLVDVELYLDLRAAGESDDPAMTASYAEAYEVVRQVVTGEPCNLIEAVAERIAARLLEEFPLREVLVRVKKPSAPVPGQFNYMGVEITRSRERVGMR